MRLNRLLLSCLLLAVALVLQVSILARLHLPGAVPDLTLLVVVGLAITYGPMGGSLVGFGAGLLTDLAPPADHAAGRYALVLCLIGYLAGLVRPETGPLRSATKPMFVVACAAVASTVLYAGVGSLVGDTAARNVGFSSLVLSALLYDLLLAPFTVPWVMALARKLDPDPLGTPGEGSASAAAAQGWLSAANGRGSRFSATGKLNGTGRVRSGLLRPGRTRIGGQRSGFGRSLNRNGFGKLGKRP
ncbi:rod shape-determining protein MreD [Wenjunlia tyrosinilytica]|uniref:Rod shape-determining protein MreD n=1 Tax=Wenjunlia tyrosinilytica TaxID=1544741 RepID=A0A917ZCR3_9ACTN|nr:rod shape-determining protein MreD [Wenjunlia tyrosinilytica]GGO80898.1 rod shape-determining protein MreD [Wenjunlia tyrosinilytica]